jgi:hypothetical protein
MFFKLGEFNEQFLSRLILLIEVIKLHRKDFKINYTITELIELDEFDLYPIRNELAKILAEILKQKYSNISYYEWGNILNL